MLPKEFQIKFAEENIRLRVKVISLLNNAINKLLITMNR